MQQNFGLQFCHHPVRADSEETRTLESDSQTNSHAVPLYRHHDHATTRLADGTLIKDESHITADFVDRKSINPAHHCRDTFSLNIFRLRGDRRRKGSANLRRRESEVQIFEIVGRCSTPCARKVAQELCLWLE